MKVTNFVAETQALELRLRVLDTRNHVTPEERDRRIAAKRFTGEPPTNWATLGGEPDDNDELAVLEDEPRFSNRALDRILAVLRS